MIKKRIFRSIFVVALTVLLACLFIFLGVLYNNFTAIQKAELSAYSNFIGQGVANEGMDYFDKLNTGAYRLTWIDADGTVLYDSVVDAASMENHANREEIKNAFETGYGESVRYSHTLFEKQMYAAKRLGDSTVIRVSINRDTFPAYIVLLITPIAIVLIVSVLISLLLASRLSRRIVRPLNALNLDEPLTNDAYDELSPLLTRLEKQQRQIKGQFDELKRKQDEFTAVTDSMNEGLILLNNKGTVLSINKSAANLFGTDQRCVGHDMLRVNRSIVIQDILLGAMAGEHGETTLALQGGEYQISASPILSGDQIGGAVLLTYDITERRRSEQMRREFTANVSHELKTPLHSISGCAEIIKNGLVKPEDIPQFSGQIYAEAQRMITLIDDIIFLSRLDEQKFDLAREELDLFALANKVKERLSATAKNNNITLSVSGESAIIEGVPQLIEEMIYNLCDNAIKYNREDGRVDVIVSSEEDEAVICVRDTGIGIPKEDCPRIFERFYRVDKSHSKKTGGTGLGLSIVKHVARLHQAKIDLKSELGQGTTICVKFPKA